MPSRVPHGVDEAAVRILGLMGASSAMEPIVLFLGALDQTLAARTRALV
jgi:hypothetical protein